MQLPRLSARHGQAVCISLGLPRWRIEEAQEWPRAWVLAPTAALLAEPDERKFAAGYTARLERFGACKIARTLERIAREYDATSLILLCHEADWNRCHRLSFAEFWLMTTGELVQEIE